MKKRIILAFTAVLTLAVLFAGCGNSGGASDAQPESSASAPAETASPSEDTSSSEPEASQPDNAAESPASDTTPESQREEIESSEEENNEMKMNVTVNGQDFIATLEQNNAVDAFVEMMEQGPVTLQFSDYAGFEKVGPLGQSLPTSNRQTTTQPGDIVLYQGNQIVMFYGSNSWSYTRLGHIDDLTGWNEALGSGDVTVTFSLED